MCSLTTSISFGLACALSFTTAVAQSSSCDLGAVTELHAPAYPPIARAAHVQGTVILMATFATSGDLDTETILSGPNLLRQSAISFVQGWRAQPYPGIRTCPLVIEYRLQNPGDQFVPLSVRRDPQHVVVNSGVPIVLTSAPAPPLHDHL